MMSSPLELMREPDKVHSNYWLTQTGDRILRILRSMQSSECQSCPKMMSTITEKRFVRRVRRVLNLILHLL